VIRATLIITLAVTVIGGLLALAGCGGSGTKAHATKTLSLACVEGSASNAQDNVSTKAGETDDIAQRAKRYVQVTFLDPRTGTYTVVALTEWPDAASAAQAVTSYTQRQSAVPGGQNGSPYDPSFRVEQHGGDVVVAWSQAPTPAQSAVIFSKCEQ
jgi:hypothetical protein